MPAYIALLRGINVGKHKRIAMVDLRALIENVGYTDVQTLLNSGNVVFSADDTPDTDIAASIRQAIADTLGMDIPVVIRSGEEMQRIVETNPFPERAADHKTLHVEFLAERPDPDETAAMVAQEKGEDDWRLVGNNLYLSYPNKLSGAVFIPKLSITRTSRNWQTVTKLAAMASAPAYSESHVD